MGRKKRHAFLAFLLLAVACVLGCGGMAVEPEGTGGSEEVAASASSGQLPEGTLAVHMLNVGQGDAILIQAPGGNALVDASDIDEREKLRKELDKLGVKRIDKLILTHPHADHIGGAEMLIKDYGVARVYDNGMPSRSQLYLGYMKLLKQKGIPRQGLVAGDAIDLGGGAVFEVLYPTKELVERGRQKGYEHDPNNESVVGRLRYGKFSMLFTGDAEKESEKAQLAANPPEKFRSQVLKAPHHGSHTSASKAYMAAVSPEAALISAGEPGVEKGNVYGHPHWEALEAYQKAGAKKDRIYWTYRNGTISVTTDGESYRIVPEQKEEWVTEWRKKKKKK